ncbi:hypothetical protein SO802_006794 [Lithocarpus litseifolius]|uniref:Ty3-gypsy retrotransposon protein n=1 Tax=Lithocarpus litseifolius TaxID=425828 RepID=A0AAW2DRS2_9ROSI
MASKKSQMSKNATKSIGGSTSNNTSTSPITRNKAKAMKFFIVKEVAGKAPVTKLTNAPPQPKTIISLITQGGRKHTFTKARDSTFILENSMLGGKSPYSTSNVESSTTSWLGSSPGSSPEVTSSIFSRSSSRTIFMLAMMTEATTVDGKIGEMGLAIAKLTKIVEEKDLQIATLMNKLEQLQDMIANTIQAQYGGAPQSSLMYSKLYTKRVDNLGMPTGMHWGLLYILQRIKPCTFEELATRAHDMELSLSSHGEKGLPIDKDTKRGDKYSKFTVEESLAITTKPIHYKKYTSIPQEKEWCLPTLKEMEERTYPFPDSDVSRLLDDLQEKKIIKLPECKRLEEMGHTNDLKYCKYHRVVSHPVEKCIVLKDIIIRLAN